MKTSKRCFMLIAFIGFLIELTVPSHLSAQDISGTWHGKLSLPAGSLTIVFHIKHTEQGTYVTNFYRKPSLDDHSKAMITYTLSEAYRLKGDKKGQKHFLALSAIADLKSAVKEYVSLRKLASLVYEDGDIDRAYNYLKCSLEDATLCNARLRTLEISQVFPIIDQAYQLKTKRQQQEMKISLICISLLSVFLLVAIFFVYKQMKKVAAARREVIDTNTLLHGYCLVILGVYGAFVGHHQHMAQ